MPQNGMVALEAQSEECLAAIEDIKREEHDTQCGAHLAIARGVVALLRVKIAELHIAQEQQQRYVARRWQVVLKVIGLFLGAGASAATGAAGALAAYMWQVSP